MLKLLHRVAIGCVVAVLNSYTLWAVETLKGGFVWVFALNLVVFFVLGVVCVYLLYGVFLTMGRSFRSWRRRANSRREPGEDVEMASRGPPRGSAFGARTD